MIGYYNYTVIATYLGLFAAVFGIANVVQDELFMGIVCVIFAGLFDMFDGKIARMRRSTEDERAFGIQLDSLTDLVAFGVLPAAIGYGLNGRAEWFIVPMFFYVLTALIRLAYFNVSEYNRQQETSDVRHFYEGLPVTTAALIFPLVWCFKPLFASGGAFGLFYTAVMVLTAVLFITPFKLKKPNLKGLLLFMVLGAVLFGVLIWQRI